MSIQLAISELEDAIAYLEQKAQEDQMTEDEEMQVQELAARLSEIQEG